MDITAVVIDDDHDTARIFSEFLNENGFHVLGVGYSGKIAVELYLKNKPDVLFLDMMMSDGSGFYAIKKIIESDPSAKIIAVTADIRSSTTEKLTELGIPIVHKPFDITDIMKFI